MALGVGVLLCTLSPKFSGAAPPGARIALFIALALSGVVALLHAMVAHDYSPETTALLKGVLQMGAMYLLGVGVYATRVPESLAPRRFDIIGSSHQLWHACVVAAAYTHFGTVLALWRSSAAMASPLAAASLVA